MNITKSMPRSKGGFDMSRYYPYGKWCEQYGCFCDDVVDITDGNNDCNGDCEDCEKCSEVKNNFR